MPSTPSKLNIVSTPFKKHPIDGLLWYQTERNADECHLPYHILNPHQQIYRPVYYGGMSSQIQLKGLVSWSQHLTPGARRLTMWPAAESINAVAAESANALGARIAIFQHAKPPAAGAENLNRLLKRRGCTGIGR